MVGISLSDETKVIEPVGEPRNTMKTVPAHKEQKLATRRKRGVGTLAITTRKQEQG